MSAVDQDLIGVVEDGLCLVSDYSACLQQVEHSPGSIPPLSSFDFDTDIPSGNVKNMFVD